MKKSNLFHFIVLLSLALAACGREPAAPPAPTTAEPAPTVESVAPTAAPQATATAEHDHSAAATAPATVADAAPTAGAIAAPAAERIALLRFRDAPPGDNGAVVRAGSYQLLLQNAAAPPAGSRYELWLVDDSFNTLSLGAFDPAGGDVSGVAAEELLANYSGALISVEPEGDDDGNIGPLAFRGLIPAGSLLHIRHVVTAFEANPQGKAFLLGAEEQLLLALEHTGFMQQELAGDDLREAQRHAEHVVNIIDGQNGASFGDLDGDSVTQNPGDGFGVAAYIQGAQQHAQLAMDAEGATVEVLLHGGHVLISGDNMLGWLQEAIAEALRVISSDSSAEAQPAADALAQILQRAYEGQDVDGDGAVAPIAEEGGWQTAYEHALNMGSFEFFDANPAAGSQQGEAPPAPPAGATEAAPEATPEATEESSAPGAAVTIDMANFAYQPGDITVAAGTAVTWVNKDSGMRHSATAADGSFDTGLLDGGQEATIVLNTPGTYIYYCTLHGSPDGSGMAATITVTD